jgi:hypothetical protein
MHVLAYGKGLKMLLFSSEVFQIMLDCEQDYVRSSL